jgi:hypothetical protein
MGFKVFSAENMKKPIVVTPLMDFHEMGPSNLLLMKMKGRNKNKRPRLGFNGTDWRVESHNQAVRGGMQSLVDSTKRNPQTTLTIPYEAGFHKIIYPTPGIQAGLRDTVFLINYEFDQLDEGHFLIRANHSYFNVTDFGSKDLLEQGHLETAYQRLRDMRSSKPKTHQPLQLNSEAAVFRHPGQLEIETGLEIPRLGDVA